MPRWGMSGTSVFLLPVLEAVRLAGELGYRAFEVMAEFPQCVADDFGPAARAELRRAAESAGLALAVHAPFTSLNPAALNPGVRAESQRQVLAAVDLCADLGGKTVVAHSGDYILSARRQATAPQAFALQWNYNLEALSKAAARAEQRGVTLCLENIGFEPQVIDRNADDLLRIREAVGSPALQFCLDIGHARLNRELPALLEKIGPSVRHVHFTDNFGEKDDHLPIGDGNYDYAPLEAFIRGFEGIVTLEVLSLAADPEPARKSLAHVRKRWGAEAPSGPGRKT